MSLRPKSLAPLAALLFVTLAGCDHAARHVTSPADGDVSFARDGSPDASPSAGPEVGREDLQRRTPLGFSEFFPMRPGNRWRYEISAQTNMFAGRTAVIFNGYTGDHVQEQWCDGDYGGVTYLSTYDSTHVSGEGYESDLSYWTLMRQDRRGLFGGVFAVNDPPCAVPMQRASRNVRPRAELARLDRERFAATPQWSANPKAWEAAWRAHSEKQAIVESIIFEQFPHEIDPERPLRGPEDGELLYLAYPLEIGREWIVRNRPEYRRQVERKETVQVPAGSFSAYRVRNTSEVFGPYVNTLLWYGTHGLLKQHYDTETFATDTNGVVVGSFRSTYDEQLVELDLSRMPR